MTNKHENKTSGYYEIIANDARDYTSFSVTIINSGSGFRLIKGRNPNGEWEIHKWLIAKDEAHEENGCLIIDNESAKKSMRMLKGKPVKDSKNVFQAEIGGHRQGQES